MRNKYFSFLFSALLACTAFPAFSAGNGDVQTRLDGYKTSVGVDGDYNKAREFLADSEAVSTAENTQAGMALEAQAKALDELARILNMDWDKDNYNSLSTVLAVRLGKDTPLAKIKAIGYKPEKFMPNAKLNVYIFFNGILCYGVYMLFSGGFGPVTSFSALACILLLAFVTTVIANLTLVYAIKTIGSTMRPAFTLIYPSNREN